MGTVGRTQPHREEVVNFFNFDSITIIMTSTTVTRLLTKVVKPGTRSLSNAPQAAVATQSTGLNFTVTEEQQEFLDLAEQFTKNEIIPVAPHYDRTGEYPWPVLKKAHETGLMNLHIPQEGDQHGTEGQRHQRHHLRGCCCAQGECAHRRGCGLQGCYGCL